MSSAVPGGSDARPPVASDAAPPPGTAVRPSAHRRRPLIPLLLPEESPGFAAHHAYVRRYWTAVMGPSAVADLLRLITAARRRRPVLRPLSLHLLAQEGLIRHAGGRVWVRPSVPPLGDAQLRRLPPRLRAEHRFVVRRLR